MNTKEYIESGIFEAYILGALSPEEEALVEAKIAEYPELGVELQGIETALQQYAAMEAKVPPPGFEEKVWEAITSSASAEGGNVDPETPKKPVFIPFQPEYRKPVFQWKYAAVWIALAGSLIANMLMWYQNNHSQSEKLAMNEKIELLQTNQDKLTGLLATYQKATNMMADTGMQTIVMHTVVTGHAMAATLYWSKGNGEAYVSMEALPQPPKGMQYQLWAIQGGKPVDMGVLPNDMANTPAMQKVSKEIMSSEAFAISLEKEGGSPSPTMKNIYVMGKPS